MKYKLVYLYGSIKYSSVLYTAQFCIRLCLTAQCTHCALEGQSNPYSCRSLSIIMQSSVCGRSHWGVQFHICVCICPEDLYVWSLMKIIEREESRCQISQGGHQCSAGLLSPTARVKRFLSVLSAVSSQYILVFNYSIWKVKLCFPVTCVSPPLSWWLWSLCSSFSSPLLPPPRNQIQAILSKEF